MNFANALKLKNKGNYPNGVEAHSRKVEMWP